MRNASRWLVVAALCACGPSAEIVEHAQHAESAPASASCKVEPPVAIQLTSRPLAAGRYEIMATATPTKAVGDVELALVLPSGASVDRRHRSTAAFGATTVGERRTLVAIVDTTERTSEISAIARVPFEGITMSRAATITVGAPRVAPRTRQYALPDGERAREVRP